MSKKFVITEKEKSRISKIHNQRIITERKGIKEQENTQATTPPTTQPAPQATTPPTTARYQTAVCPAGKVRCDQTVLRAQVRMNDECGLTVKLIEDGIKGDKTNEAWGICKPKLKPTKQIQGGGGQQQGTQPGQEAPKVDAPLTATDIATLTT